MPSSEAIKMTPAQLAIEFLQFFTQSFVQLCGLVSDPTDVQWYGLDLEIECVVIKDSYGQRPLLACSTSNTRPSTSDPLYRSLIHRNNIILDPSGRQIEKEIQELLDTHILKRRNSPPLTEAEVFDVVDTAVDLLAYAEGKASDFLQPKHSL